MGIEIERKFLVTGDDWKLRPPTTIGRLDWASASSAGVSGAPAMGYRLADRSGPVVFPRTFSPRGH